MTRMPSTSAAASAFSLSSLAAAADAAGAWGAAGRRLAVAVVPTSSRNTSVTSGDLLVMVAFVDVVSS